MNRPYVLITVNGGVAELAYTISDGPVDVDILDFDNMNQTERDALTLSDREWDYLREQYPDILELYAPSYYNRMTENIMVTLERIGSRIYDDCRKGFWTWEESER